MSRSARWCVVVCLMLICGCMPPPAEQPEPNTHLPGFDVWVPQGIVIKQGSHAAFGSYEVRSGLFARLLPEPLRALLPKQPPSTRVSWLVETHPTSEPFDVAAFLDGVMRGVSDDARGEIVSVGERRWISTYGSAERKLIAGYARCEPWLTVTFIVGMEGGYDESLARKIVKSVRCRIDAQKVPTLPVSFHVPKNFGLASNARQPTYISTAGGALVINFTNSNISRNPELMEKVMGAVFAAAMQIKTPLKATTRSITRKDGAPSTLNTLSGDLPDFRGQQFQVGTLYCKDLDATALLIFYPGADPSTNALELTKSMQCLEPDAVAPKHATVDTVFAPVCEAGDLVACQHFIMLMQQDMATGSVMSLERARARACELGDRTHCT